MKACCAKLYPRKWYYALWTSILHKFAFDIFCRGAIFEVFVRVLFNFFGAWISEKSEEKFRKVLIRIFRSAFVRKRFLKCESLAISKNCIWDDWHEASQKTLGKISTLKLSSPHAMVSKQIFSFFVPKTNYSTFSQVTQYLNSPLSIAGNSSPEMFRRQGSFWKTFHIPLKGLYIHFSSDRALLSVEREREREG